eukprot:m.110976 g.110976  ORF g.110976 m.110976 type:complete len:993 (-) comp22748_c0_seq2:23-3001(-)
MTSYDQASRLTQIVEKLSRSDDESERHKHKEELQHEFQLYDRKLADLIDDHHESFFTSLHSFIDAVQHVDDAKQRVGALRHALVSCKTLLQCKRDSIRNFWIESLEYKETIALLDKIEEIKQVPEKVNGWLESKHFVHAARILATTTRALCGPALEPVRALRDLHHDLVSRQQRMHEVLIEELHQQIYQKNDSTVKGHDFEYIELQGDPIDTANLTDEESLDEDPTENRFRYISLLVKALTILRRVPDAVQALVSRLKQELSLVVDKSVAFTHDYLNAYWASFLGNSLHLQNPTTSSLLSPTSSTTPVTLASSTLPASVGPDKGHTSTFSSLAGQVVRLADGSNRVAPRVLLCLLSQLYIRMRDVLLGHQCVLELVDKLRNHASAADLEILETYKAEAVWKAVQIEIELLMADYLNLGQHAQSLIVTAYSHKRAPSSASLFSSREKLEAAEGKDKMHGKKLFSFANSQNAIEETSVNIERSLRESKASRRNRAGSTNDKYTNMALPTKQLLCDKQSYNITGAFKVTKAFIEEVCRMFDLDNTQPILADFTQGFVTHVLLPQLRGNQKARLTAITNASDNNADTRVPSAPKALLESTHAVHEQIGYLCSLMIDLPFSCPDFASLVISLLTQYRGICRYRYSVLVRATGGTTRLRKTASVLAAEWESSERVRHCLHQSSSWKCIYPKKRKEREQALENSVYPSMSEKELLLDLIGDNLIETEDILVETNTLKALAAMHESMQWLGDQIATVAKRLSSNPARLASLWPHTGPTTSVSFVGGGVATVTENVPHASIEKMFSMAEEFNQLAESCLIVLRLDLRVRGLKFLLPALRKSNYCCDIDAIEADPLVVMLNKDLSGIEELLSPSLAQDKLEYLFQGLADFFSGVLIQNMRHIRKVNEHGVKRMCRTIFALQQNLTNITKVRAGELDKAMQYYELLYLRGEQVLQSIVANSPSYTEMEYRVVLGLISASQKVPDPEGHATIIQDLGAVFHDLV